VKNLLKEAFLEVGVEYFGVLSYSDCRETAPNIMKRESFAPKSVIVYLVPYYSGETVNLSRYAAGVDYHLVINKINSHMESRLKTQLPDLCIKGYGDKSPIDERHAAIAAGLGVLGRNGLIINEKYGSYVFIGEIVSSAPPELLGATEPFPLSLCEGCGACLRACPTGILRGEEQFCLSEITQRKGELLPSEVELMRRCNTVWGCDLCQSSCPHNRTPVKTPIKDFYLDRIEMLDRATLDGMSDEEFSRRAFAWRKRATVERNIDLLYGKKNKNDN